MLLQWGREIEFNSAEIKHGRVFNYWSELVDSTRKRQGRDWSR